jgi:PAS domain S-box-containing protein
MHPQLQAALLQAGITDTSSPPDQAAWLQLLAVLDNQFHTLQSQLELAHSRLKLLVDNLQAAILVETHDRTIAVVNQQFCDLFQINAPPPMLIGADCSQSADQVKHLFADPAYFVERIERILFKRVPVLSEVVVLAEGRTLERDYIPVHINGIYQGHLWQYRDVTERYRTDRDLREKEYRYRALFETSNDAVFIISPEGIILDSNERSAQMLRLPLNEIIGSPSTRFVCPSEHPSMKERRVQLMEGGSPEVYERRFRRNDNTTFPGEVKATLIYDQVGNPLHIQSIVRDVTERNELQARLAAERDQALEVARLKSEFLATMSHEIRTPMNGVLGMSELLMMTPLDEEQRGYAEVIYAEAHQLLRIINDILEFSRLEAGKVLLESVPFELGKLLESIRELLAPRLQSKPVQLHISSPPNLPTLLGDPGRLRQVLLNLTDNAVKFTPQGTVSVEISVLSRTADSVMLRFNVRDTGIGIASEKAKQLFQPFTQVDGSVRRKYGGTGLGLAIARGLVERMGGEMGLESTEGEGSCFWFESPFAIEQHKTTNDDPPRQEVSTGAFQHKRILIVDDNPVNLRLMKELLKVMKIKADTVTNGADAVRLMEGSEKTYDLILMDCQMPEMDGFTATRLIRQHESKVNLHTPIVALTAMALNGDREACLAAGMDDYLSKPIEMAQLTKKLQTWLTPP